MIRKCYFGSHEAGDVEQYTLQNAAGMTVSILNLGAALREVIVPDREGRLADVIGGFDSVEGYLYDPGFEGAIVGRVANRIKGACFELDGKCYQLTPNSGDHLLHGGAQGFSRKLFEVTPIDGDEPSLRLHRLSPDGEEGFPGNLDLTVTYTLTANNAIKITYCATTDKKTLCNLTNHAYFNLSGFASGDILDHELWVEADSYLELSESMIPTGKILAVKHTPFDFTTPKPIGRDLFADHEQIKIMGGYDVALSFVGGASDLPRLRATVYDPKSGRELRVYTDQPSAQLYTSNGAQGGYVFKGGLPQRPYNALAFETQAPPDSVHHPHFPSVVLDVGECYESTTVYEFAVRKE